METSSHLEALPVSRSHATLDRGDSKRIRKVTRLAFPPKEHDLFDAEDGHAAFNLLDTATEPFDAILLGLNMPRMDGCQFIRALRQRARHRDTPVVLATSERETSQLLIDARALSPARWSKNRRSPMS
ncbi:MAG TPA: response regulator [Gemmatimonadales bacterium]|nr:response regulator [Gemmatimonadales bacterium]